MYGDVVYRFFEFVDVSGNNGNVGTLLSKESATGFAHALGAASNDYGLKVVVS